MPSDSADQGTGSDKSFLAPRVLAGLTVTAALAPPIRLAMLVDRFGVDVPYYDEWPVVGLIRRLVDDEMELSHFAQQHSVHRVFFPRLILVYLARATGWNVRYELAVNFLLAVLLMIVAALPVVILARRTHSVVPLFLIPVISLLIFSLAQYENWMWGWQSQIFLSLLCVSAALLMLSTAAPTYARVLGAGALGGIASFSFANGLLLWPLGLVPIVLLGRPFTKRTASLVGLWIVIASVVLFTYFHDFKMPPRVDSPAAGWSSPGNLIKSYVAYAGGAFASMKFGLALAMGAAGLAGATVMGAVIIRARTRVEVWLPGAVLMAFSLGSGVLIVAGRADYGAQQALASRYITISNLFWIGLLITAVALILDMDSIQRQRRLRRWGMAGMLALIAGLTLHANVAGFEAMRQFSHLQRVLRYQLLLGDRSEQMQLLYPDVQWLHWYKEVARRHDLWAWRPDAPPEIFAPPPPSYEDL